LPRKQKLSVEQLNPFAFIQGTISKAWKILLFAESAFLPTGDLKNTFGCSEYPIGVNDPWFIFTLKISATNIPFPRSLLNLFDNLMIHLRQH
jgi:hypothetical protein